jgi:hypothetical protein
MSLEAGSAGEWAGAIVAALGFFFALLQLRSSTKVQRSQFLLDATQRYFGDVEVRQLYYDIDYEKFSLVFENGEPSKVIRGDDSPVCFKRSEHERNLDALLYSLDTIGRIYKMGVLKRKDAEIFAFQARRVLENSEVKKYLEWIDQEREKFDGERPPHQAARLLSKLAKKRGALHLYRWAAAVTQSWGKKFKRL